MVLATQGAVVRFGHPGAVVDDFDGLGAVVTEMYVDFCGTERKYMHKFEIY